jgi:hypothetical protein
MRTPIQCERVLKIFYWKEFIVKKKNTTANPSLHYHVFKVSIDEVHLGPS